MDRRDLDEELGREELRGMESMRHAREQSDVLSLVEREQSHKLSLVERAVILAVSAAAMILALIHSLG
jgi:cell division protein FtsL